MASIERIESLVAKLRGKAAKAIKDDKVSCLVGYTAMYAVYVHENLSIWGPPGQRLYGLPRKKPGRGTYWSPQPRGTGPKFLERPAREMGKELGDIVAQAAIRGLTLAQGLVLAGMALLRASQRQVPVDTGTLRASGFVRLEDRK